MAYTKECRVISESRCNDSYSKAEARYVKPHAEYPATEKWNGINGMRLEDWSMAGNQDSNIVCL
jgi:hypothetical protein